MQAQLEPVAIWFSTVSNSMSCRNIGTPVPYSTGQLSNRGRDIYWHCPSPGQVLIDARVTASRTLLRSALN